MARKPMEAGDVTASRKPPGDASPPSPEPTTEGQRLLLEVPGSLAGIAAKLGTAKQVVHRWRRGEKVPGDAPRLRLRDVYGIAPDAWERAPGGKSQDLAAPRVRGRAAPTLDQVVNELTYLYELRQAKDLIASAKVRLSDSISKNLALKARLERDQELLDDRIVREHPAWLRIRAIITGALKPYPDAARALAEALASEGA